MSVILETNQACSFLDPGRGTKECEIFFDAVFQAEYFSVRPSFTGTLDLRNSNLSELLFLDRTLFCRSD